jgi:formylglycine-generating enzyme required for sulfatase activity
MRHFLAAAAARQTGLITVGLALSSSRADFCARYRSAARQPQELDLGTSHPGFRAVPNGPALPLTPDVEEA